MVIHLVCAARPNFMKIAPLYHALKVEEWIDPIIVHTGQHYDLNMSDVFFSDLKLPMPDIHLGVGSGSHAEQTAEVMRFYENVLIENRPDLIIVVGDVNSTLASAVTAAKLNINIAHLEAGLRSYDRTMPEEINRIVTDVIADILWTPSEDAVENLLKEGIEKYKIFNVGNIMIDSFEMLRKTIESQEVYKEFNLEPNKYGLITLHRPSNVDNVQILESICNTLNRISEKVQLIFPIHPRTRKNLEKHNLSSILKYNDNIIIPDPLGYIRFMNLLLNCKFILTDSGGIQEETTYLGIPCLTLRPNTERPITLIQGTNKLCNIFNLENNVNKILHEDMNNNCKIKNWDGKTAKRIVQNLKNLNVN